MTILRLTNRSRGFYTMLGPYLSRRDVAAELGGPIWDDDDARWWVARDGRVVVGFCALQPRGSALRLRSGYVLPEARGRGIYRQLFEARLASIAAPARLVATVTDAALPLHLEHGFTALGRRGRYTRVAKEMA